jgi:hypothetical protein
MRLMRFWRTSLEEPERNRPVDAKQFDLQAMDEWNLTWPRTTNRTSKQNEPVCEICSMRTSMGIL